MRAALRVGRLTVPPIAAYSAVCGGGGFLGWVEFDRFSNGTISGDGGGQTFYVDSNVVNGMVNDPDFMGETAIPAAAGHYSGHPAPAISNMIQVAFRAPR